MVDCSCYSKVWPKASAALITLSIYPSIHCFWVLVILSSPLSPCGGMICNNRPSECPPPVTLRKLRGIQPHYKRQTDFSVSCGRSMPALMSLQSHGKAKQGCDQASNRGAASKDRLWKAILTWCYWFWLDSDPSGWEESCEQQTGRPHANICTEVGEGWFGSFPPSIVFILFFFFNAAS